MTHLEEKKLKLENFSQLLSDIKSLDAKKQLLWLEIYDNALTDRQNAYTNYVLLVKICEDKSSEHAVHARSITAYLERMAKANDQMLKLAELIAKAQEKDDDFDENDLFEQINKQRK